MFKKIIFLVRLLTITGLTFSQPIDSSKRIIRRDVLNKWHWFDEEKVAISPDGKYVSWVVVNQPARSRTVVLASIETNERHEFPRGGKGFFSSDSHKYILIIGKKIAIVTLGLGKVRYIENAERLKTGYQNRWISYEMNGDIIVENLSSGESQNLGVMKDYEVDISGQWLVGHPVDNSAALILYQGETGNQFRYTGVENYELKDDGTTLLLKTKYGSNSRLQHINLLNRKTKLVFVTKSNQKLNNYCVDNSGSRVAFMVGNDESSHSEVNSIWYYEVGDSISHKLFDNSSSDLDTGLFVSAGRIDFTKDGRYVFCQVKEKVDKRKVSADDVKVDVWNYKDNRINPAQFIYGLINPEIRDFSAVVPVAGGKLIPLTRAGDQHVVNDANGIIGDHALVIKNQVGDRFWEYKRDSIWLVSLKDGNRKLLPLISTCSNMLEIDPKGKSVIAFDRNRGRHLYRYEIATGIEQKLSEGIPDWQLGIENPYRIGWPKENAFVNPVVAARTAKGDQWLIYDSYDLWQIDITGKKPPVNLTNGYGRRNKIVFRLALPDESIISDTKSLLLTAFNEVNKSNGFYRTVINGNPDSLFIGQYFFSHSRKVTGSDAQDPLGTGLLPIKATETNAWLVCRESATEAPNYFYTKDFKTFNQLTDLQPQKDYNWYTTELVNYEQANGVQSQGILYKPHDFDPNKKYPVIFHYYEQWSHTLNRFIQAQVSEAGNPNIPWYVSRGYLVFRPDFYFERIYRGRSTMLGVEGAARELMKRPYVDGKRLGLVGLSQGGEFTNYIVTHSKMFAAAFEGCGFSDVINGALRIEGPPNDFKGVSGLERHELGYRGSNIWEDKEAWIEENAILHADKVTSPLLIMHNKADWLPFEQAVEMFTALRRLDKPVWLLQYDNGGHGVNGKDALDLTRRMTQYFDHYLKGLPPPRWMTQGIPAALKGIETRFELDPEGSCGKDCKICQEKNYPNNP